MVHFKIWIGLALGGAFGACGRYLTSTLVQSLASQRATATFPWGTLSVNVLGCLLMGFLYPWFLERNLPQEYRVAILTGLLGAFTTWSSFGVETVNLLNDGQWGWAALNVFGTNAACFTAVMAGYRIAQIVLQG